MKNQHEVPTRGRKFVLIGGMSPIFQIQLSVGFRGNERDCGAWASAWWTDGNDW